MEYDFFLFWTLSNEWSFSLWSYGLLAYASLWVCCIDFLLEHVNIIYIFLSFPFLSSPLFCLVWSKQTINQSVLYSHANSSISSLKVLFRSLICTQQKSPASHASTIYTSTTLSVFYFGIGMVHVMNANLNTRSQGNSKHRPNRSPQRSPHD